MRIEQKVDRDLDDAAVVQVAAEGLASERVAACAGEVLVAAVQVVRRPVCRVFVPAGVQRHGRHARRAILVLPKEWSRREQGLFAAFVVEPRHLETVGAVFKVPPVHAEGALLHVGGRDEEGRVREVLRAVRKARQADAHALQREPGLSPIARRRLKGHGGIDIHAAPDLLPVAPVRRKLERLQIDVGRKLPGTVPGVERQFQHGIGRVRQGPGHGRTVGRRKHGGIAPGRARHFGDGAGQRFRGHGPNGEQGRAGEVEIVGDDLVVILPIYVGNVAVPGRSGCAPGAELVRLGNPLHPELLVLHDGGTLRV